MDQIGWPPMWHHFYGACMKLKKVSLNKKKINLNIQVDVNCKVLLWLLTIHFACRTYVLFSSVPHRAKNPRYSVIRHLSFDYLGGYLTDVCKGKHFFVDTFTNLHKIHDTTNLHFSAVNNVMVSIKSLLLSFLPCLMLYWWKHLVRIALANSGAIEFVVYPIMPCAFICLCSGLFLFVPTWKVTLDKHLDFNMHHDTVNGLHVCVIEGTDAI